MNTSRNELPRLQGLDVVNRFARLDRVGGEHRVIRCPRTLLRKPIYDTEDKARRAAEAMSFINPGEPLYPYSCDDDGDIHYHLSETAKKKGEG